MRIAILLAVVLYLQLGRAAHAVEVIAFEPNWQQSSEHLQKMWREIPEDKRKAIQSYLLMDLGLSSTGFIQLLGVYRSEKSKSLLHFQQLDQHGSRLLWSALVDFRTMSARVLYHNDPSKISSAFVPMPEREAPR